MPGRVGRAWAGEDVLDGAYSEAETRGAHVEWGLCEVAGRYRRHRCCRWTAGRPPGAPKTKDDAHALEIQSLVTQKS